MTDRINNNLYIGSGSLLGTLVSFGSIATPGITVGTLYASVVTSANAQISGTISAATYVGSFVSSGSIATVGATVGTLYASVVTSANVQISDTISAATYVGSLVSSGSIATVGATVGTLYASNITVGNLYVSGSTISMNVTSVNMIETNTTTGNLNVTNGITTGSINTNTIRITSGSLVATFNSNTIGSLFTTNGNVGIGITSPSYALHVSGAIYATGDISAFSDKRLKTDIVPIDNALEKVNSLRGVYYTSTQTNKRSVGVIAQEIQEILPEVVATDGEYLGVAYGNITGLLIESIKELTKRCTTLEKCLSELLLK
jgi:hypothetical protein